jgi:hypothetical protein
MADDTQMQQMPSKEDNEEERQEKLPEDNDRPFSLPDDAKSTLNATNQAFDTGGDPHEAYDAGDSQAPQSEDQGDRGVVSYDPEPAAKAQNGPVESSKPKKDKYRNS